MYHSDVALDRYRKALAMYQQAAEAQITSPRLVYQKVELEMHLLQLHYLLGTEDQAESIFERAMEAGQRLKAVTQPESQQLTMAIQHLQRGVDAMRTANDLELANTSEAKLKSVGLWLAR
jgi:tetratricopeptide (TPR) repeat protein